MTVKITFRAQSFTSLKTDLRQDINGGFLHLAGALKEHFLEGSVPFKEPTKSRNSDRDVPLKK